MAKPPTKPPTERSPSKSFKVGRNASTGKFTTVDKATSKPSTHVVERVPKPGNGDKKK